MTDLATVTALRSYPVRSLDGSDLSVADVGSGGLTGDRAWTVVDDADQPVTARQVPALAEVRVELGPDGPVLDLPGGPDPVAGPAADAALSAYVGRPVRLVDSAGPRPGAAAIHLVSRQAVAASIGTTSSDPACDLEAPRANLTLDLAEGGPAELERAWVGREVAIGSTVLRVERVPTNCLGVYAEVVRPGRINLGDSVRLRD
jgi:uncharacterized protein YcbX